MKKRNLKLSLVASAVIVSITAFSGCGGEKYPDTVAKSSLAGGPNVSDAYIIGTLTKPATAVCNDRNYTSELEIGPKGKLTFKNVKFTEEMNCTITLEANSSLMDTNNNGEIDDNNTKLSFELSAPAEAKFVTPLTTLYVAQKLAGKDVSKLMSFLNFDPVEGATDIVNTKDVKSQVKIQKFMVLMEILKTSLKTPGVTINQMKDIDLTSIIKEDENLSDFNATTLVNTLPATVPTTVKNALAAKAELIASTVVQLQYIDPTIVNLNTLLVQMSDGGKTSLEEAIKGSLQVGVTIDVNNIIGSVIKASAPQSVHTALTLINTTIIHNVIVYGVDGTGGTNAAAGGDNNPTVATPKLTLGTTLALGSKNVSIAKDTPFALTVSHTDSLDNFYNIALAGTNVDKTFDEQTVGLNIEVKNQADANDYVKLALTGAKLSSDDGHSLQTKFTTSTEIEVQEKVAGVARQYHATLPSELINSDLSFNLQTIVDTINDPKVNNGINRMKNYLTTAGKKYDVKIELTGLDSSKLKTDFTTISGVVTVQ